MGHDEETAQRVRRLLADHPDIVEKRMVGGRSFILNGTMCCGVTATGLMVRVGPEGMVGAVAEPYVQPIEFGGKRLSGFVEVQPASYGTERALAKWVQRGIDFASRLQGAQPVAGGGAGQAGPSERAFHKIADRLLREQEVWEGTGFGTNPGLRVGTKIFAMLGREGELIVKLPKDRVDQLVDSRAGARFDPRRDGRLMKEWATVPFRPGREWGGLVDEALRFVRSTSGKPEPSGRARKPSGR